MQYRVRKKNSVKEAINESQKKNSIARKNIKGVEFENKLCLLKFCVL